MNDIKVAKQLIKLAKELSAKDNSLLNCSYQQASKEIKIINDHIQKSEKTLDKIKDQLQSIGVDKVYRLNSKCKDELQLLDYIESLYKKGGEYQYRQNLEVLLNNQNVVNLYGYIKNMIEEMDFILKQVENKRFKINDIMESIEHAIWAQKCIKSALNSFND